MVSVNRVMLRGIVGSDQFIRRFKCKNGSDGINFSLKTENNKSIAWHNVVYFIPKGESFDIKQGYELSVDGRIDYEVYTDKQGMKKTSTNIIANKCEKVLNSEWKCKTLVEEAKGMFPSANFSNGIEDDSIEF